MNQLGRLSGHSDPWAVATSLVAIVFGYTISSGSVESTRTQSVYEMTGDFLVTFADHAFEIASLFVSAAALAYAALALRAARQAIQIAKESDLTGLRLKARDEISAAERSLNKLQEVCSLTRDQWERHIDKHYPVLGRGLSQPKETRHIAELERAGRALLQEIKDATPIAATSNAAELERFIKHAQETAMRIERLTFDLMAPKPLGR